jgi:predicted NUDIX family NTP pyrophosphohydrolase
LKFANRLDKSIGCSSPFGGLKLRTHPRSNETRSATRSSPQIIETKASGCLQSDAQSGFIPLYSAPMAKTSAGLLMFRLSKGELEVLLVHLGGPYWAKKDKGAWFIPKGEINPGEDEFSAAKREFEEETGIKPNGNFIPIGRIQHKSGKIVVTWAFEGDCDPVSVKSNTFTMEWPPRSNEQREFPEVDRAQWLTVDAAKGKIQGDEFELLKRLERILSQ